MKAETQILSSRIPYPAKNRVAAEIAADAQELGEDTLPEDVVRELEEIHASHIDRALSRVSARGLVEVLSSFVPVALIFYFIFKEPSMIQFVREGGPGMFVILALGFFLLGKEALSMFRLLIVRDHSSLKLDTSSVWMGCLGLMFIGIAISLMGFRLTVGGALASHAPTEILLQGLSESVTSVILASLMSALVIFMHYATRQILFMWRAPIV